MYISHVFKNVNLMPHNLGGEWFRVNIVDASKIEIRCVGHESEYLLGRRDGKVELIHESAKTAENVHWIICQKQLVDLGEVSQGTHSQDDDLTVSEYFQQFV